MHILQVLANSYRLSVPEALAADIHFNKLFQWRSSARNVRALIHLLPLFVFLDISLMSVDGCSQALGRDKLNEMETTLLCQFSWSVDEHTFFIITYLFFSFPGCLSCRCDH